MFRKRPKTVFSESLLDRALNAVGIKLGGMIGEKSQRLFLAPGSGPVSQDGLVVRQASLGLKTL